MAFEYGISANLNVDKAIENVEKLIKKLDAAEQKAGGLKVNISINNELVSQLKSLNDINRAQKQNVANTAKQAQDEERLAALQEKTAGIKQKNAQQERLAEEQLNQAKQKTAAQEQKNAQNAASAEQRLAAQKKADDDADLHRAQKLRTEEEKTATQAAKTASEKRKSEDAAAKAAQDRANAQRKADIDAANAASKYAENAARGEERVQQEQQRTFQSKIASLLAIVRLIDQKDRAEYNAEQRAQRAADARHRREQQIQKEQKANDDAIARDLEKQARIEQAQQEIEEQKVAKTRELRAAIEANQKAQAEYNRVLAKSLPTVNEIRRAMQNLSLSQENLKTAQYRANSPLSFLIGKVGPEGSWTTKLQRIGGGISKVGEVIQGATQAYQAVQEVADGAVSSVWNVARGFFNSMTNAFSNLSQEGMEAFGTLEMAEIGFANFFDGSATEFVRQIKEKAVEMPMVGAADLARSVQYIAPLAKGDSNLALSAVEGVMKSIVYSGNDVSQYGSRALQNLTQVASGNLTATDIKEMMRQMPALPRLLASTETGKELLEGGQITTKAVKNYIAKYGSDAILGVFKEISEKSEASDIYKTANTTFKGAIEQLQEKMVLEWQNVFDESGAANALKDVLNELSKEGGIIEQFGERLTHYARIAINWVKENETQIKQLLEALGEGVNTLAKEAKTVVTQVLSELEIVQNGKLNVSKFKELIRQFTSFIKGIISGFGGGLKSLLGLLDTLRQKFGPEVFEKIGHAIGLLASPMGKLITMLGRLASNFGRAAGGLVTVMSGMTGSQFANKAITKTGEWWTKLGFVDASSKVPRAIGNAAYTVSGGRLSSAGVATGVSKVASFAGKAVKGAGITALGLGATEAVKGLAELAGASKEVVSIFGGLGTGITLAIAGFTMFGPGGAVIGAILGAVVGFVTEMERQKEKLYQENAQKSNDEIQQLLSQEGAEALESAADQVFQAMEAEGVKIDRGSDSGKYAEQMLIKKLDELMFTRDENGKVISTHQDKVMTALANGDLSKLAAGWYRDQEVKHATAQLSESEKFLTVGGNVIDFKTDTAKRDNLAKFIQRNWLNGDTSEYDYENRSAETIVRDYLQTISPNGKAELTDRQYAMLFQEENERSKELEPLLQTAAGVDGLREDLKGLSAWQDVKWVAEKTDQYGRSIWETLRQINKDVIAINVKNGTYGQDSTNAWGGGNFIGQNTANAITSWRAKGAGGKFGGQSDDNKYTMEDGSRHYVASIQGKRDKMAEIYGKRKGDNDDFEETINKMDQVANNIEDQIMNNLDNKDKLAELEKDYDALVSKRNELQGITVGDWGALFKIQNELSSLMGKYNVQFRAGGGIIAALLGRGRGVDTVPAFLQPGEYVMRRSAVEKAGTGVFNALNRGDFAGAAHALGNKFNNSWDQSHHWSNQITTNNNNTSNNYFFAGGQVRGRRQPYRSMANRVATI